MKRVFTAALAAMLCLGLLAGCGNKDGGGATPNLQMKEGQTVETVVNEIADQIGVAMAAPLDDEGMKNLFYLDAAADAESYAGVISMVNVSADNVVCVKAKAGKAETVKQGLEKRLDDVRKSFETYLVDQSQKAQMGRVIEKGDYFFLLIVGESPETFEEDYKKANEIIDAAF